METLHEIVLYLPRHVLKRLLLFQPYPLGQVASYVYFSMLSLHLGVSNLHLRYIGIGSELLRDNELIEWHKRRSQQILQTIIENDQFARRVQTLKIYAPRSAEDSDTLTFLMGLLACAIPKLISLRTLECNGFFSSRAIIVDLPTTLPRLKALRLTECIDTCGAMMPVNQHIDLPPHIDQLTLCEGWYRHLPLIRFPHSSVTKLHITSPCVDILTRCITPSAMRILTHLSLADFMESTIDSMSVFEIALRDGVNLQCLRIRGRLEASHSQYFRQYPHALPCLTELGIFVSVAHFHADPDFFPAVCDFVLQKSEQLVHLELGAPRDKFTQDKLGFDGGRGCWAMFKNTSHRNKVVQPLFPKLESLSMPLPAGKKNISLHYSRLIPRAVTRLTLSRDELGDNCMNAMFKVPRTKKRRPSWPSNLRLVCININPSLYHNSSDWYRMLVRLVAECISTVHVVKIVSPNRRIYGFWSVSRRDAYEDGNVAANLTDRPQHVRCNWWNIRQATYLSDEVLDCFECDDTWFEDY